MSTEMNGRNNNNWRILLHTELLPSVFVPKSDWNLDILYAWFIKMEDFNMNPNGTSVSYFLYEIDASFPNFHEVTTNMI